MVSRNSMRQMKKSKRPRLDLPPGYTAQTFVRTRDNGQLSFAAVDGGLGWDFALADVPDYSEFTTLYDAYTLDKVDITYVLENNTPGQYPVLYHAPDYDDAGTPLTVNSVTTHQNVRVHAFSENARSVTFSIVPRCLAATYQPGVSSAYAWAKSGTIVDMANTTAKFYGAKTWLSHFNSIDTPGARIRTILRYHMRFIGQR
jgi:hypothetical protein